MKLSSCKKKMSKKKGNIKQWYISFTTLTFNLYILILHGRLFYILSFNEEPQQFTTTRN
jgi:uncharacterized protein YpmS